MDQNPFESGHRISHSELSRLQQQQQQQKNSPSFETPPVTSQLDHPNPFGAFNGGGDPFETPPNPGQETRSSNPFAAPVISLGFPSDAAGEGFDAQKENDDNEEAFGSVDALALIDQDEKEFEEANRFNQTETGAGAASSQEPDLSGLSGGHDETRMSALSTVDPMSRSSYFQMNSSRYYQM